MRKIILAIALVFVAFMTSVVFSLSRFEPIDRLYVFGDSLSDVGMLRTTGEMSPSLPYFQGRFSNGQVWVEYLSDHLQLTSNQITNYARGGATTGSSNIIPSLITQVESFTKTHPKAPENALYVLWMGANDYLQGANNATAPVANIQRAIATIVDRGAKNFIVANLPDLGKLPATRTNVNAASLSALTQAHNQALRRVLKVLNQQHPEIEIFMLDAYTLYQQAIKNPAALGFTNVTSTCLASDRICSNPNQYLFWDGIHPTTAAHRIIGERAFSLLSGHLIPS